MFSHVWTSVRDTLPFATGFMLLSCCGEVCSVSTTSPSMSDMTISKAYWSPRGAVKCTWLSTDTPPPAAMRSVMVSTICPLLSRTRTSTSKSSKNALDSTP